MKYTIELELRDHQGQKAWRALIRCEEEGSDPKMNAVYSPIFDPQGAAPWAPIAQILTSVAIVIGREESK